MRFQIKRRSPYLKYLAAALGSFIMIAGLSTLAFEQLEVDPQTGQVTVRERGGQNSSVLGQRTDGSSSSSDDSQNGTDAQNTDASGNRTTNTTGTTPTTTNGNNNEAESWQQTPQNVSSTPSSNWNIGQGGVSTTPSGSGETSAPLPTAPVSGATDGAGSVTPPVSSGGDCLCEDAEDAVKEVTDPVLPLNTVEEKSDELLHTTDGVTSTVGL